MIMSGCTQPVIGDGDLIVSERALADFTGVETYGVNVEIRTAKSWSFTLSGDRNVLSHVHTEVVNGRLRIDTDAELYPTALSAIITLPVLDHAGNYDGADLRAMEIEADTLTVMASGEGHTELAGQVGVLEISSAGGGVRNAADLSALDVRVLSSGSGSAWLTVTSI